MSYSRKRRFPPARMRRTERPRDDISNNDNADAQYTALLLREEELIEAIRMVDPEEASKMERNLDKVTRVPWSKLEQSDQSSDEVRLDRLHSIERAREEVEEVLQKEIREAALKKAHEDKIREHESRRQRHQKVLTDEELTRAIQDYIVKRSRPKRCPDNGEFSWSRRVFHIKQQIIYDEQDKILARSIQDQARRYEHGFVKTVPTQFYSTNHERNRHTRRLPERLAHQPVNAVTLFNKRGLNFASRLVAKRIWIIVTHADDEDEYQRLF